MANYDPKVIQKFADKLYSQANTIVFLYTLIGAAVGGFGGYAAAASARTGNTYALAGAVILGLIGLVLGIQRSFMLKVQAQTALCQMRTEENTRKAS